MSEVQQVRGAWLDGKLCCVCAGQTGVTGGHKMFTPCEAQLFMVCTCACFSSQTPPEVDPLLLSFTEEIRMGRCVGSRLLVLGALESSVSVLQGS